MDKNKKAILFDVDGVIVDSEPLHFAAHKKALAYFGIEITLNDYLDFGVAQGDNNLYEKVSEKFGVVIKKEDASKMKKQFYREIFAEKGEMMPGILESLQTFSKKYVLAVVSSGSLDANEYVLSKFDIRKYFKAIITKEDVEKVKPYPDVYLKALEKLNLSKDEYVAIEDSQTGVEAAKNAGIKCIAIPCGFTKNQDFSRADILLSNINEMDEKLIENLY
jgi:HAD superfamily hydrolase (TIGR01509 family)